jgi:hypothetical protein
MTPLRQRMMEDMQGPISLCTRSSPTSGRYRGLLDISPNHRTNWGPEEMRSYHVHLSKEKNR